MRKMREKDERNEETESKYHFRKSVESLSIIPAVYYNKNKKRAVKGNVYLKVATEEKERGGEREW